MIQCQIQSYFVECFTPLLLEVIETKENTEVFCLPRMILFWSSSELLPPRGSKYFKTASFAENCILDLYNNFKETDASSQESKFVVMGDFNLPNVNWESNTTAISVDQSLLDSMTQELLLEQIIRSPTHKRGNILDLVFVSQPDAFGYEVLPASFSDHYPLIISYDYLPCYVAPFSSEFSASGFNQNMLESKIDLIDFEAVSSLQNTSEFLLKTLVDVISSCLVRKRKKRKLFPFYYSSLTMHSINKLETAKQLEFEAQIR